MATQLYKNEQSPIQQKVFNMKKTQRLVHSSLFMVLCSLFLLGALFFAPNVSALTPTLTPSPSSKPTDATKAESFNQRINNLKDRIASKVAELNLVEKRGIFGTVTDTTQTQITLSDNTTNDVFVDVDELTKFASPSAKENFGISDIKKNTTLGILGIYNKESRRLLARFVDVMVPYETLFGEITDVDKKNFTIAMTTKEKKSMTIDIETTTKTTSYRTPTGEKRTGFSAFEKGLHVMVFGYQNRTDTSRISASRILLFPDIAKSPTESASPTNVSISSRPTPLPSSVQATPTKKITLPAR